MDYRDLGIYFSIHAGIILAFSAIYVGLTVAAFWILGELPLGLEIDIEGFLDEYALPFFLASIVIHVFNRFVQYLMKMN